MIFWSDRLQLRMWWEDVEGRTTLTRNVLNELVAKNVLGSTLKDNDARVRVFDAIANGVRPRYIDAIVKFVDGMPEFRRTGWLFHHPFWKVLRGDVLTVVELSDAVDAELARLGLRRVRISDDFTLEIEVANGVFERTYADALDQHLIGLQSATRTLLLGLLCAEACAVSAHDVVEPIRRAFDYALENSRFGRSLWLGEFDIYEEILGSCRFPRFAGQTEVGAQESVLNRARGVLTKVPAPENGSSAAV